MPFWGTASGRIYHIQHGSFRPHTLGVCEVVSAIGAFGMREVYKARDTKLDRDIALKISVVV